MAIYSLVYFAFAAVLCLLGLRACGIHKELGIIIVIYGGYTAIFGFVYALARLASHGDHATVRYAESLPYIAICFLAGAGLRKLVDKRSFYKLKLAQNDFQSTDLAVDAFDVIAWPVVNFIIVLGAYRGIAAISPVHLLIDRLNAYGFAHGLQDGLQVTAFFLVMQWPWVVLLLVKLAGSLQHSAGPIANKQAQTNAMNRFSTR